MNGQKNETIFSLESASLKFGNGAIDELGWELNRLGLKRPLIVAHPHLRTSAPFDSMRDVGTPSGIAALASDEIDISLLVEGALKQQRLLVGLPKSIDAKGIESIFLTSLANW
ncbi:MAG: hypothetical protein QM744_08565 [Mesorhizobium sp.]